MNDPKQLRNRGEVGKLRGMELAANRRPDNVAAGKIALLRALLASPDGTATIDDATDDLAAAYRDGGRWRGSVCRSLATVGVTEKVAVVQSDRPSRHRGYIGRWRLVDRRKAMLLLSQLVAALDCRIGAASDMPNSSPINKEPAPGTTGTGSVQKTFQAFEKGFSDGKTN